MNRFGLSDEIVGPDGNWKKKKDVGLINSIFYSWARGGIQVSGGWDEFDHKMQFKKKIPPVNEAELPASLQLAHKC